MSSSHLDSSSDSDTLEMTSPMDVLPAPAGKPELESPVKVQLAKEAAGCWGRGRGRAGAARSPGWRGRWGRPGPGSARPGTTGAYVGAASVTLQMSREQLKLHYQQKAEQAAAQGVGGL